MATTTAAAILMMMMCNMLTNDDDNNDFDGDYANTVDINDSKVDDHDSGGNDADIVYESVDNDNVGAALPLLTDATGASDYPCRPPTAEQTWTKGTLDDGRQRI
eukprot:scaffold647900_cov36-Prasinocladus_malaysianus.AAC.1